MKLAIIQSPWRRGAAASSNRNSDQAPVRSSTEGAPAAGSGGGDGAGGGPPNIGRCCWGSCCGCDVVSGVTVIAVRPRFGPGQGAASGEFEPGLLSTAVPLMSSFATIPPLAGGGTTARLIDGMLPPVAKKASRI